MEILQRRCALRVVGPAAILTAILLLGLPPRPRADVVRREGALVTIRETGEAQLGDGTKAQVKEKAKAEALRRALEIGVGVHVTSQTTVKNLEVAKDVVNSYSKAYVKSVREVRYDYDAVKESGRYEGEFTIDTASMAAMAEAEQALAASRDKPIEASVFVFDAQGRMLPEGGTVRKGDRFNVMVQPLSEVHAYVIGRDSRGNLFTIFPNRDVSQVENPLRAGTQYYFPPRDSDLVFAFDENPGRETFHFLFSAVPMADMDALFEKLQRVASVGERETLAPIIQERVATRGFAVQSKTTHAPVALADNRTERAVGEVLKGSGAFVKSLSFQHAP
ncbi:MAG: DUF4384 domain-containing protein [Candidatus Lambdaproteobacteria bacterium]|nr:DUF4384 domain-containing protein [Candidatus Lambdaproteobacteria bacterium]